VFIPLDGTFDDPDGDFLEYTVSGLPPSLFLDANNTIAGTLGEFDLGSYLIEVAVSDGRGGINSTSFFLDVIPVSATTNNNPFISFPLSDEVFEEGQNVFILLDGTFSDPDNDPLTFTVSGLPATLFLDVANTIVGTLTLADVGTYTVTVFASDGRGGTVSDSFILDIISSAIPNTLPIANDDFYNLLQDTNLFEPAATGLLINDTDAEFDPLNASFNPGFGPFNGTVVLNPDGSFQYMPDVGFAGTDTFSYIASDGLDSSTALVTLTVDSTMANSPPSGLPTISGSLQVGQILTADPSPIFDPDGLGTFSFQWFADEVPLAGEIFSTLTLKAGDVGKTIVVDVSYLDGGSTTEFVASIPTSPVTASANSPPTGLPTITGIAQVGQTLAADPSPIFDPDGLTTAIFSYQWFGNGSPIGGPTTVPTLTLQVDDVGKAITVEVSYVDDGGTSESVFSLPTGPVIAFNIPQLLEFSAPELFIASQDELFLTQNDANVTDGDTAGTLIYGDYSLDSFLIGSSIDLTGVANLANLAQIEATGTTGGLPLDIADVLNIVGDTSLETFLLDDSVILDGRDLSNINSGVTASDVLEDGETYVQYVASLSNIDLYIHSNLADPDPIA